jgi:hypothetical protein
MQLCYMITIRLNLVRRPGTGAEGLGAQGGDGEAEAGQPFCHNGIGQRGG